MGGEKMKRDRRKVDRRELFKTAGLGSVAIASLSTLFDALAVPAGAVDDETAFVLVCISKAKTVDGVDHRLGLHGAGKFNPASGKAEGAGIYLHVNDAPRGTPKPLLSFGRWKVTEFISYGHQAGKYGPVTPGILVLQVGLIPQDGPAISAATLRIVCNSEFGGLRTGEPEGFQLTIPGAPYGTFVPTIPQVGVVYIGMPWG